MKCKNDYKSAISYCYSTSKNRYDYMIEEVTKLCRKLKKLDDIRINRELNIIRNMLNENKLNILSKLFSLYNLLGEYMMK